MLTGGIYGSGPPKFELKRRVSNLRDMYRLPGTFTFTNGSAVVTTSESMINILAAGDTLTPNKAGRRYFVASVDSVGQVTLSVNFAGGTVTDVAGYTRFNVIVMPLAKLTKWRAEPFGRGGGPTKVMLTDGRISSRVVGFRLFVEFTWEVLTRQIADKIITMYNFDASGEPITVSPHNDVPLKWDMLINTPFNPESPAEKLIGTNFTILFESVTIVKELPLSRSTSGSWGPKLI
jgi:hypothetical protein